MGGSGVSSEFQYFSLIPQCIRQIAHNTQFCYRNVHTLNFLLQNGALWDTELVHCGICATGLLPCCIQ